MILLHRAHYALLKYFQVFFPLEQNLSLSSSILAADDNFFLSLEEFLRDASFNIMFETCSAVFLHSQFLKGHLNGSLGKGQLISKELFAMVEFFLIIIDTFIF